MKVDFLDFFLKITKFFICINFMDVDNTKLILLLNNLGDETYCNRT